MRIDVTRHQGGVTQLDDPGARGRRGTGADRQNLAALDHYQPRRNQRAAAPVEQVRGLEHRGGRRRRRRGSSEEHTSELQSLMRISYAVFCLKKKKNTQLMYSHM